MKTWFISLAIAIAFVPSVAMAAKPVILGADQVRNGKSAVIHLSYPNFKMKKVVISAYSYWTTTPEGKQAPQTKTRSMWLEYHRHEDHATVKLDANGNGSIRLDGMPRDKMVSVRVKLKHKVPGGKTSDLSKKLRFSMQ